MLTGGALGLGLRHTHLLVLGPAILHGLKISVSLVHRLAIRARFDTEAVNLEGDVFHLLDLLLVAGLVLGGCHITTHVFTSPQNGHVLCTCPPYTSGF